MKRLLLHIPLLIIVLSIIVFSQEIDTTPQNFIDGTIDATFNGGGVAIPGGYTDHAVQNDDKIVGLGSSELSPNYYVRSMIRVNPNGTIDRRFGLNGRVIIDVENLMTAGLVEIQKDGKILVVGMYRNNYDFNDYFPRDTGIFVARFLSNGAIDEDVGEDGYKFVNFEFFESLTEDFPFKILLQDDGKIVVCSKTNRTDFVPNYYNLTLKGESYFSMFRLNANGDLDSSFGNNGKVLTNAGYSNYESYPSYYLVNSPIAQIRPNGKIIVAHTTASHNRNYYLQTNDVILFQYNQDGTVDETFANNGSISYSDGSETKLRSLALQSDEKLLVLTDNQSVLRFNIDGSLDYTFSNDKGRGIATGFESFVLFPTDDNKLIVVSAANGGSTGSFIQRFNSNMELDTTFGINGTSHIQLAFVTKLIKQSNNHLIVGSNYSESNGIAMAFHRLLINSPNTNEKR